MQTLKTVILKGWPDTRQELPTQVTPYYSYRDELTLHDGLIIKGENVVVPESMRMSMKEHLHISHLGGKSMLRRARECIFWPGMSESLKFWLAHVMPVKASPEHNKKSHSCQLRQSPPAKLLVLTYSPWITRIIY